MNFSINNNGYVDSWEYKIKEENIISSDVDELRPYYIPDEEVPEDWNEHAFSYRWDGEQLVFDEEHANQSAQEEQIFGLRVKREQECFSIINRGQLWYEDLTQEQKEELRVWYHDWLNVTNTLIEPERPTWLD